jgi:hypothetical protein
MSDCGEEESWCLPHAPRRRGKREGLATRIRSSLSGSSSGDSEHGSRGSSCRHEGGIRRGR